MPSLEIDMDQLSARVPVVRKLLNPLRNNKQTVACDLCKNQYKGCKVIAAHDGGRIGDDFNKWHFKTSSPDIWSQYYELWQPFAKQSKLYLNRAYLNIYMFNRATRGFEKLISIHCDPYEKGTEPLCKYKHGPHLHVQKAEHPIPKCHFPLNLIELDRILSSIENITAALENAIEIICNEVLNRYN